MPRSQQKHKVSEALHELGYDFNHFVLGDFLAHIEKQRQKPIRVQDFSLVDVNLFGAWIATPEMDYILVSDTTHSVHRAHIILHEVGHIVLGHPVRPLKDVLTPEMLRWLRVQEVLGCARYVYDNALTKSPEEQEAEEFVFQIRDLVSRADRLYELIEIGTSIEALRPVIDSTAS